LKLNFPLRFIVCHKHPVSGRLYFLRFATGQICGPQPLPKLAVLTERTRSAVIFHPAAALRSLARDLEVPEHLFALLGEFHLYLEVPHQFATDGVLPIYLAAVAGYELPGLPTNHQWIEMPDSFELPYLQREILRAAYEFLMG
jgi:hypothetical protein